MQDLDAALAEQTPSSLENTGVYDLPSLTLDGIQYRHREGSIFPVPARCGE